MNSENTREILKKLSKAELKRLGDFIKSPYFNSAEKLIRLYDVIKKAYPSFDDDAWDSEIIHKKVFPGREFKFQAVKNLYWEFGVILEKFLAYEEFGSKEDLVDLNLVESLRKRKFYRLSGKLIDDYKKKKEDSGGSGEDSLYYSFKMDRENRHNVIHFRPLNKQNVFDTLNSESEAVIFFSLNMFYSLAYTLSLTSVTRYDGKNNLKIQEFFDTCTLQPEKFLKYIDSSKHNYAPAVKLRYLFYHYTVADISRKEYLELKDTLVRNINKFGKDDLIEFFKAIIEIILLKLAPADDKYLREAFELRKLFCELKIYPDDSIPAFSSAMLQNSLIIAMILREYDWAENFLNEYINYIDEDLRENELNYSMGLLSFRRKKYGESLEYLNKVKYSQILEKVNVRFYYVMNYIELKLYDAAASMVKSIKQFHRENKEIPEMTSVLINDSVRFFNEIIKCSENNSKLDYSIYARARSTKSFYHSAWILEKMEKMI
jgi:hypothetical protein